MRISASYIGISREAIIQFDHEGSSLIESKLFFFFTRIRGDIWAANLWWNRVCIVAIALVMILHPDGRDWYFLHSTRTAAGPYTHPLLSPSPWFGNDRLRNLSGRTAIQQRALLIYLSRIRAGCCPVSLIRSIIVSCRDMTLSYTVIPDRHYSLLQHPFTIVCRVS